MFVGIAAAVSSADDWRRPDLVVVLLVLTVLGDRVAIALNNRDQFESAAPLGLALAATLAGPGPAVAIAVGFAIAMAVRWRSRPLFLARNLTVHTGSVLVAAVSFEAARSALGLAPDDLGFAALVVGAYVVTMLVNNVLVGFVERIEIGVPVTEIARNTAAIFPALPPAALLTAATAFLYGVFGIEALAGFGVVLVILAAIFRELDLSRRRAEDLAEQSRRVADLAESRGRLVAEALAAEDRERRRLAEALHDEAVQNLLAARHDLADAERGDGEGFARTRVALDRTVNQLREAIFELHPEVLRHAGLKAAIEAVAAQHARRGGFSARIDVDERATGVDDALLFSLAREQLSNAARHAGASTVTVQVERRDGTVTMEVADDGRGMAVEGRDRAVAEGHIGLASSAERVEALGGRFEIESTPGAGTRVRTTIPVAR